MKYRLLRRITFFKLFSWNICSNYWAEQCNKKARKYDSIILPENIKSPLIKDMEDFSCKETAHWYHENDLPYKRSYLLYGPPGSGKSSFIQAMAGLLKRNVYYLQPANPKFTDDTLKDAILLAEKKSIVVLEDIDSLFDEDRKNKCSDSPLTFSGLLNALDGITSIDGHIFVMTTNFIERLDPALIRDGRVDYRVEFPSATREQMVKFFLKFFKDEKDAAEEFANNVEKESTKKSVSMAKLQNHFIKHRRSNAQEAKIFVNNDQ